jgi:hypothetical protein
MSILPIKHLANFPFGYQERYGTFMCTLLEYMGDGVAVSEGPYPTLRKGVLNNFETTITLGSDLKQVDDDIGDVDITTEHMDGGAEQLLRDI